MLVLYISRYMKLDSSDAELRKHCNNRQFYTNNKYFCIDFFIYFYVITMVNYGKDTT